MQLFCDCAMRTGYSDSVAIFENLQAWFLKYLGHFLRVFPESSEALILLLTLTLYHEVLFIIVQEIKTKGFTNLVFLMESFF